MTSQFLLSKFIKNNTDLALPFISILIVIILIPLQILPTIQKIANFRNEINISSTRKSQMQQKLTILTSENSDSLQSMLIKVNQAIPSAKEIPSIFSSINNLASATSVSIEQIQVNVGEVSTSSTSSVLFKTSSNSVDFQTSISGTFPQVKDFLSKLEKTNRIFRIRSISFRQQEKTGVLATNANINLIAYFQALPSTIGKVEDPINQLSVQEKNNIGVLADVLDTQDVNLPSLPMGKPNPFSRL